MKIASEESKNKISTLRYFFNISRLFQQYAYNDQVNKPLNFATHNLLNISNNLQQPNFINFEKSKSKCFDDLTNIFDTSELCLSNDSQKSIFMGLISNLDLVLMDEYAFSFRRLFPSKEYSNIKIIPHNNIQILEEEIRAGKSKYRKIWFFGQSIYPLNGTLLPTKKLQNLLAEYEQFYLCVRDCYGLGWYGEKGRGIICEDFTYKDKIIISAQLSKSFSANGEITIVPKNLNLKLKENKPTIDHSLQISIENAAAVYLSAHFSALQTDLINKVNYFKQLLKISNIPFTGGGISPYIFIPTRQPEHGRQLSQSLLDQGFYVPFRCYPEVPVNHSGISINIGLQHPIPKLKVLAKSIANENFNYQEN